MLRSLLDPYFFRGEIDLKEGTTSTQGKRNRQYYLCQLKQTEIAKPDLHSLSNLGDILI